MGPAGLFYSSVNTALTLILLTLMSVLIISEQVLFVLLAAYCISAICGWLLVRSHNRKVKSREFTLSTYIGRVSCKVVSKTRFKRDYSRPLARAKFKRKIRTSATYALALSCLLLTGIIALPNATAQLRSIQKELLQDRTFAATIPDRDTTATTEVSDLPQMAAATDVLSNIGVWQLEESGKFKARLQGNTYQSTSAGLYRPTLTLSCDSGGKKISFAAYEVLGTEHTHLTLQFDKKPQKSREWKLHDDYRSAYIAVSQTLLSKLSTSEQLRISYRPFGADTVRSINFSLGDGSDITRKMRRQCA